MNKTNANTENADEKTTDEKTIIAISASGNSLDDDVDARFGRCPCFIFVELKGKEIKSHEIVENISAQQTGGVGITTAELVAKKGSRAVISGNIGPRAFSVFNQLGIKVYPAQGKIRDAVLAYANGELKQVDASTGPMHMDV